MSADNLDLSEELVLELACISWREMWQTLGPLPCPTSLTADQVYPAMSYSLATLDATHPEAAVAARKAMVDGHRYG